jgi:zinc transporter, ZIP family
VFFIGERAAALRPALIGLAVGLMSVASVVGLLIPALEEGSLGSVAAGLFGGAVFLLMTKLALAKRDVHVGKLRGARVRQSVLVFAVLFVHSLPEGMAMGTAWASERAGLGLFVVLAIALQNIPEGTSVAIPMASAGFGRGAMFWAAAATSAPQPIAAPLAFLAVESVQSLLPSPSPSRPVPC